MAMTAAERQAKYRANRPLAGEGNNGERRITSWVNTGTALALARLAARYGVTQREILERLIGREDDMVLETIDETTPEWRDYFNCVPRP